MSESRKALLGKILRFLLARLGVDLEGSTYGLGMSVIGVKGVCGSPCAVSEGSAGLGPDEISVNVSWVEWNLNTVIVPLSIFKQIIEVEYKETKMWYGEINMEIVLQALDKTN